MAPTPDVDAFDALYAAEWGRVVAALVLVGSDRRTAEEIAQETFIRAWARWDRVVVLDRPAGWLYTTAFRLLRRRHRRLDHRTAGQPTDEARHRAWAPADDVTIVDRMAITEAIGRLPVRQRQAVVARHVLGLSTTEAAEALGVSPEALRQLLHRGVAAMRTTLEPERPR